MSGGTVLLVMPRMARAEILDYLSEMRMPVLAATNCEEAFQYLSPEYDVAAVLTAMTLPDGTWETVLRQVEQSRPLAQVIVCTDLPTIALCRRIFHHGASDLLIAPYDSGSVRHSLDAAKDRSWMQLNTFPETAA